MKNSTEIKNFKPLAHPPLSAESLTGRGFSLFQRAFFGSKKHRRSNTTNVIASEPGRARQSRSGFCGLLRHFIPRNDGRVCAFTLAEVLITLVIIGIIAALTIPNLMTKYQQHVFENQFKKSLYTISQIVARTRSELGVSNLASYCTESNRTSNNGTPYYNRTECINSINNQINKVSKANTVNNINRTSEIIKTYNAQSNLTYFDSSVRTILYTNQLADSSFLGFYVHNSNLYFAVDLNAYKKPNRLGYDIFIFSISKKNDTVTGFQDKIPTNTSDSDATDYANTLADNPNRDVYELWHGIPCNLESTRVSNGIGCAYFALRNKCPYDNTKTYWECLK